jgi:hypothetical protein
VIVAALGRLRRTEHVAFPLAAVVLAGVLGAAMPLLIDRGTSQGVAGMDIAAPIPASQGSEMGMSDQQRPIAGGSNRGRSTEPPQKSTLLVSGGASPTAQGEGLNAFDQPSEAQARSSEEGASGASEPSVSPAPHASAGMEPDAEQPTSEPSTGPAPGSPADEEAEEDEQAGGMVALCHKAGSKPKTIVVGEGAVEGHLTHGDTIGVCP